MAAAAGPEAAMVRFVGVRVLGVRLWKLLVDTSLKWQQDRCGEMGAALAYYFLFSLFPVLLTVVSVVGFLLGPDTPAVGQILSFAQSSLPPRAFGVIENYLLHLNERSVQAGVLGLVLTMMSASTVFTVLDRSVDIIWKVHDQRSGEGLTATLIAVAAKRLLAFAVVLGTAVLLVASLLIGIAARVLQGLSSEVPGVASFLAEHHLAPALLLERGGSLLLLFLAISLLLYFLPSTTLSVGDLLPGAGLATVVLGGLQHLVSHNVLAIGAQFRSYGAIGGVMILMLWIFLVFQVFLIACELTYVYTHLYGSRRHRKWHLEVAR
jgi:membrane protein